MKKRASLTFLVVLLGLAAAILFVNHTRTYDAVKPLIGPAVQAVYASGIVEPSTLISIAPRMGGRLTSLMVDEGQRVEAGQILAQLEDTDFDKSTDQLRAKLELAEKDYARKKPLHRTGALSKQSYDTAKSNLASAKAALEQVQAQMDFMKLIAPENGMIIRRDGEIGEYIAPGTVVFSMQGSTPLRITVEVDEEDIPLVQIGQKTLISADAFPGKIFNGRVTAITPKGDPVSRSYRVRIAFEDQNTLMSGMTAEANIITHEEQEALLVPASAVKDDQVVLFTQGKLRKQKVETGAKTAHSIEILSGLSGSDTILKTASFDFDPEDTAKISLKNWTLSR